ncbi:hypothetical protein HK405_000633, partial [Cladochytrium tenue]
MGSKASEAAAGVGAAGTIFAGDHDADHADPLPRYQSLLPTNGAPFNLQAKPKLAPYLFQDVPAAGAVRAVSPYSNVYVNDDHQHQLQHVSSPDPAQHSAGGLSLPDFNPGSGPSPAPPFSVAATTVATSTPFSSVSPQPLLGDHRAAAQPSAAYDPRR